MTSILRRGILATALGALSCAAGAQDVMELVVNRPDGSSYTCTFVADAEGFRIDPVTGHWKANGTSFVCPPPPVPGALAPAEARAETAAIPAAPAPRSR
ncbi:hypothetical protein [Tahibacter amnicola]|uniref:Uncharacterized protein n=1 Tax=Tahibacter amnicola TaxID=2976241 RepID=A0ABY6BER9_9GAMM|nr:hypothetical protein [Tahibacter amnicola]UXI68354.1 hypothetical protein N4264_01500 [Tahibacter amnicola]